jgi:hypothetical protein
MLLQPLIRIIYAELLEAIILKMWRRYHQGHKFRALKDHQTDRYNLYTLNDSKP